MAPNLAGFPDEILMSVLGRLCLHCTGEYDYDTPDGYFRAYKGGAGGKGQEQVPGSPSWYSNDHTRGLHSMCLVSRRFLSLAQPILHHTFLYGYGNSWKSSAFSWDRRLSAFLRTLLGRPDLAALIRRIYVHPYLCRHVEPDEVNSALNNAARVLDHLNFNVAEYTAPFQEMLKKAGRLQTDALKLLGVVLALVPNLDRLSLQVTGHTGGIPAQALQTLAPTRPGLLSRLKTLDICCRSAGLTYFSLDHHASGILEVASYGLETLNLHMCGSSMLRIGEDRLYLRHLRITQSELTDKSFGALLSACAPGLETFVHEASYPYIDKDDIVRHFNSSR